MATTYTSTQYAAGTGGVRTITASETLTRADHKAKFRIGTDALVITLPPTEAGLEYTFINVGAAGNNIITISPNASDGIFGSIPKSAGANADATTADGLVFVASGTDDKDLINTKATANKGDRVTLVGNGTTGWEIVSGVGIWASE